MSKWSRTVTAGLGGRFQILFTKLAVSSPMGSIAGEGVAHDVTYFRGAPTQLESFSSGDPFGDSTAVITFPSLTGFDDLDSVEVGSWLGDYSSVDIWWIPGAASGSIVPPPGSADAALWMDPLTDRLDAISPVSNYAAGVATTRRGFKIWEGFVASLEIDDAQSGTSVQAQCQGALFQLDRYLQKPFYPPNPQTLESLIATAFDHTERPHLRTQPLSIAWPAGWAKIAPAYTGSNVYAPNVKPGTKWSGYTTRSTGSWDRALTGFIQDNIAVMLTQNDSGVTPGNQWTVMLARQGTAGYPAGRTPVLQVRDRFRAADFAIQYGGDGVQCSLTRDTTQMANLIYGDGTDDSGTVWRNAVISHDGQRTDYAPLAASATVYPAAGNALFDAHAFASEAYYKYGSGFSQPDAVTSAEQTLQRDLDPGWAGTITVSADPSPSFSRWQITAGQTVKVLGLLGSGVTGINFHVSAVQSNPMAGTVQMTVDTRFRDLLNLQQALDRTKDVLTPSKLLQVNRTSVVIEDIQAPWDYSAGSGFVPKASTAFYAYCPTQEPFPYSDWSSKHPPFTYPSWYVKCDADAPSRAGRWAGPIPILMSEKGTIARSEFYACDKYGIPIKEPFHCSIYYNNVTSAAMPRDAGGPSPFISGAFTSMDPSTGEPWPPGNFLQGDNSMIICWGNADQPAGFSPGVYADANGRTTDNPTGLLEDDSTWTFDCTNNPNFNKNAPAGQTQPASAITVFAMFYCEYTEPVYFQGRLYRQPQGT